MRAGTRFSETLASGAFENRPAVRRLAELLRPLPRADLDRMAARAAAVTRRHFGNTMRMFAPLYLSNECINNCRYCGFSRDNPILRVTLTPSQVVEEARHLFGQGFRQILLVAGEHPRFVSDGYLEDCLEALRAFVPSLAIEVGPMEESEYRKMVNRGCEGLVVYQETYDRDLYRTLHTSGPKRDFDWRLACPERAHSAGFRRIGVGALFGLADWRDEALRLGAHLDFLQRHCWKAHFTVAFPRMRPHAGGYPPPHPLGDSELVQLVCAFRLVFPETGIVLSTREPARIRNVLARVGTTTMSAGSHTEPGGYTGQGRADLHLTVRGRRVERDAAGPCVATGQFEIADDRSPAEVAAALREAGLEPVWKDWDAAILDTASIR